MLAFFGLYAHARGHPEGSGNGGKHGDYDVEDFTPKVFVSHFFS